MHARLIKLLSLSGLAAGTLLGSCQLQAASAEVPSFSAAPCCQLCPEAKDPKNYVTRSQQDFTVLMQGKEDWLFRSQQDLQTEFDSTPAAYERLREVHDAFKARGIDLVIVYQPTRGMVDRAHLLPADYAAYDYGKAVKNFQGMLGRFSQMGYYTPDLSTLSDDDKPAHDFYFRGDQHWTPYGAQRTAQIVAQTIKQIPAYKDIPRREFETHISGRLTKNGTLMGLAGQLCNTSYSVQYSDSFATEPKSVAADSELFGDAPLPQITLVGTSHSGKNYNFDGFLEQNLNVDVLNAAFPGGGLEGSMLQYLGSEDFQKHPPKIVVWEFSPLYKLDQDIIWRQILAMLDNGCEDKPVEIAQSATLQPNTRTDLLVNGTTGVKDWVNGSRRLDIKFKDPTVKDLYATLWYLNGRHEELHIEKPTSAPTDGRFAFDMRQIGDWGDQTLLALELHAAPPDNPTPPPVLPPPDPVSTPVHVNALNASPPAPVAALEPQPMQVKLCLRKEAPNMSPRTAQAGL